MSGPTNEVADPDGASDEATDGATGNAPDEATDSSYTVIEFLLIVLRNVSQVMLQNNALSGAVILAGIFYQSIDFGIAAVIGSIVSILTAMFLKTDKGMVTAGLYGFNGVLTAIAIVFYCETAFDTIDISWWLIGTYVIFGAILSTVLTAAIGAMLSVGEVPALTAPFIVASWLFVAGTHFSPALEPGHHHDALRPTVAETGDHEVDDDHYGIGTWWEGVGKGFGEIFFQDNAVSGYLILLGVGISSRISAAMAVIAALLSIGVAEALHISEATIHMGMFSYSAILTAIAIGGLFYLLTVRSFIFMLFGIVLTTWLYAALAAILLPLHLAPYTAPFVVVTWIMLYSKDAFTGLVAIPPAEATNPEDNLRRLREAKA